MRLSILIALFFITFTSSAQTYFPGGLINNSYRGSMANNINFNDSSSKKKWFISKYSGLSTSYSFFKGGNAMVITAPIGLQLNRSLSNNVFAFAGVSVAPSYINFRSSFLNAGNKYATPHTFKSDAFAAYARAELGLMYVNDERTFSIAGSIIVEKQSPLPYGQFDRANQSNNSLLYIKK